MSTISSLITHTSEGKRLQSMDLLKFVAIFLVLWGHSERHLLSTDFSNRAVFRKH